MNFFILDIDGTIAVIDESNEYFNIDPMNFKCSIGDKIAAVIPETQKIVSLFVENGYKVIVLSARNESDRVGTCKWLNDLEIPFVDMYLRPDDSDQRDDEYKGAMLDLIIEKYGHPMFALEDRPDVIEMFKKKGVFCFAIHRPD